jgi:hypothetical protein
MRRLLLGDGGWSRGVLVVALLLGIFLEMKYRTPGQRARLIHARLVGQGWICSRQGSGTGVPAYRRSVPTGRTGSSHIQSPTCRLKRSSGMSGADVPLGDSQAGLVDRHERRHMG